MPQEMKVWQGSPPQGWDEWLGEVDGNIFQSSIWSIYQQAIEPCAPVYLMYCQTSGDRVAGATAFLKQSRIPFLSRITKELVLPTHPFVFCNNCDTQACVEFFRECERVAEQMGCCRLVLDSFYAGRSSLLPLDSGFQETMRWEFVVDLGQDTDQIWSQIGKDHREKIRKFQKNGFEVIVGETDKDLKLLKLLRESTQGKRAEKGQEYDVPSDDQYYERLYNRLVKPGFAKLFLAVRDEEPVAGILFLTFQKKAYSMFSGSTPTGYKFSAQSGLFWEAVKNFKQNHFQELNRGGVSYGAENPEHPLHGIYQFKKRLGTTPLLCRSGVKVISPLHYYLGDKVRELRQRYASLKY